MAEYIDIDAPIDVAVYQRNRRIQVTLRQILESNDAKYERADVRPAVRGKWIDRDDDYYGWNMWACSACGEEFVLTEGTPDMNEYHFCPNCGADMRGKADEDNHKKEAS